MKEGLEEFLKRIEAKPTNETLIDRFVTLVLEEDVLERILYLKKLVGLLLTPNPYAALKAAALELQEARKERLNKEYEIGALKDVESCFLKLEKMENAQLVRDEINKLQSDMTRESTITRARTPPPMIPQPEPEDAMGIEESPPPLRQARVHFRLPAESDDDDSPIDHERTQKHRPQEAMDSKLPPPSPPRNMRAAPPLAPEASASPLAANEADFNSEAFGFTPKRKMESTHSSQAKKEFYDKTLEDTDDRPAEDTRRSSPSKASSIKVGPNILEVPDDREPSRPRNSKSAFDVNDMFTSKSDRGIPLEEKRPKADKAQRPLKDVTKANRARAFDSSDYGDSNSMFQESQHVHFPETTANRSMTRVEARGNGLPIHDRSGTSAVAAAPMENTEILPESRMLSALSYDNEVTRQLDPEELARSILPPEPAFPPHEFDIPPYEPKHTSTKNKVRDPFAAVREPAPPLAREPEIEEPSPLRAVRDPFAGIKDPFVALRDGAVETNDPFASLRDPIPVKDPIPFPKEAMAKAPASAPAPAARPATPPSEPKWSLLRDRLRLLTGIQISRSHANDFVLRLLGENSSRGEQHEVLSILMRVLEGPRQPLAEQRFLAFLFEELQPKALHQLLGALKIGDQNVIFFVDYLHSLMKERQLRRTLNVIHAVIIPGLDLSWYQESYRFLLLIWPELGLKGWHWLEEEGPMAFCDRLSVREDLLPATLLA